jgi:hypothetical protein
MAGSGWPSVLCTPEPQQGNRSRALHIVQMDYTKVTPIAHARPCVQSIVSRGLEFVCSAAHETGYTLQKSMAND